MDGTSNNTPTLQSNSKFEPITLFSNDNPNPPYLSTNFSNSTNQRILQSHYSFTQYNNDINDQNQYNFTQQNKDNIHYDQEQTHHSFTHHNNDINFDRDQTQYSFTNHNNHYKDEHLMPSPIITSTKIPQLPSNATTTPVNLKKPKKDYSNLEKKHNCMLEIILGLNPIIVTNVKNNSPDRMH
ncbi:hypothetical protein HDU92_008288 [Lobulomyces angularis]|nr:hypothetical protein HDU92_008288 [Lobulomyces angularis]